MDVGNVRRSPVTWLGSTIEWAFGMASIVVGLALLAAEPASVPHFDTEIIPVFTKAGCNGGACHGAAARAGLARRRRERAPQGTGLAMKTYLIAGMAAVRLFLAQGTPDPLHDRLESRGINP